MEAEMIDWFRKHKDVVYIISSTAIGVIWMTSQSSNTKDQITLTEKNLTEKITKIEKDIVLIKTSLIMKDIIPSDLAVCEKN